MTLRETLARAFARKAGRVAPETKASRAARLASSPG
jgi:hypothetical protein